ncbi:carboxymuconolactone decarboxylase family protein [Blastopirellula marina]|uniref:Peroxidase n=1 Tax=Blastopirellula marina TaxID=124 RepID=A0A2S8FNP0_9BACT|nr:carboxymuconolactone decarboxylase family protein [Blastopirellula marina]PQO33815.1 peroxidase [Blastopirellula marina]PTL43602.1 carboxymuconolactone decarboxylase family protein [Blastopirellula marina]
MPRLQPIAIEDTSGHTRELVDAAKKKLGKHLNIIATMANSPAVLESYLGFSGAMGKTKLPAQAREAVSLAIGEKNQCQYCVSAHTTVGKMVGFTEDETVQIRQGVAADPKVQAVIDLAVAIAETKGLISDEDFADAKSAGLSDEEITEVVGLVALNIFTNFFNHVAGTEVDFPKVELLASV